MSHSLCRFLKLNYCTLILGICTVLSSLVFSTPFLIGSSANRCIISAIVGCGGAVYVIQFLPSCVSIIVNTVLPVVCVPYARHFSAFSTVCVIPCLIIDPTVLQCGQYSLQRLCNIAWSTYSAPFSGVCITLLFTSLPLWTCFLSHARLLLLGCYPLLVGYSVCLPPLSVLVLAFSAAANCSLRLLSCRHSLPVWGFWCHCWCTPHFCVVLLIQLGHLLFPIRSLQSVSPPLSMWLFIQTLLTAATPEPPGIVSLTLRTCQCPYRSAVGTL